MNKVLSLLPAVVDIELDAANKEHPPFSSLHEGYAVLLEEVEETQEAVEEMVRHLDDLWHDIRADRFFFLDERVANISNYANLVAAEAIQVAAMARKLQNRIDLERVKA